MAKSSKPKSTLPQSKSALATTKKRLAPKPHASKDTHGSPPHQNAGADISKRGTKQSACLTLLVRPNGATLKELQAATGWQPHSVRGFLAGAVKKKLGFTLTSSKSDGDVRRYRVVETRAVDR